MKKILDGAEPDENRLLTEAALFADKSNIDEELTRLRSHKLVFTYKKVRLSVLFALAHSARSAGNAQSVARA